VRRDPGTPPARSSVTPPTSTNVRVGRSLRLCMIVSSPGRDACPANAQQAPLRQRHHARAGRSPSPGITPGRRNYGGSNSTDIHDLIGHKWRQAQLRSSVIGLAGFLFSTSPPGRPTQRNAGPSWARPGRSTPDTRPTRGASPAVTSHHDPVRITAARSADRHGVHGHEQISSGRRPGLLQLVDANDVEIAEGRP
jgi:hypothetical protein